MAKAQLFIRGMKEPVELEEKEALAAQKLIGDSSKSDNTPFSIEDVWTGKKGDMKFVAFPKVEKAESHKRDIKPMSKAEAEEFEKDIEQDKEKARSVYGKERKLKDGTVMDMGIRWREFFWERNGALRLEVSKLPNGDAYVTWYSRDAEKFIELDNKIESYWAYCRIRDFAESKKVESLESLAGQMDELKEGVIINDDVNF